MDLEKHIKGWDTYRGDLIRWNNDQFETYKTLLKERNKNITDGDFKKLTTESLPDGKNIAYCSLTILKSELDRGYRPLFFARSLYFAREKIVSVNGFFFYDHIKNTDEEIISLVVVTTDKEYTPEELNNYVKSVKEKH